MKEEKESSQQKNELFDTVMHSTPETEKYNTDALNNAKKGLLQAIQLAGP